MGERKDFFISYTGKDAAWARWISWELEAAGWKVIFQEWDFKPGSNFVLKMQDALEIADRVMPVLSEAYFKSRMAAVEWAGAFSPNLDGEPDRLLPVLIEDFSPPGLLKKVVYVSLVGLSEDEARRRLLAGLQEGRLKPGEKPDFPGAEPPRKPHYPGAGGEPTIPSAIGPDGSFHLPTEELPKPTHYLPPGSRMPLKRNRLFVGREEDLLALAEALNAGETAAIGEVQTAAATGAGGIGKTQLAAEFVYRYGQLFPGGVYWMSFADPDGVEAEVASCGLEPDSPLIGEVTSEAFGEMKLDEQVRRIRLAWKEPVPRLLVFDNCEDPDLLEEWRPEAGGCRVLVTSRRQEWERALGVRRHLLDKLPRPRSLDLLLKHRPDLRDDPSLDDLAEELGDFPLALALAGSYLEVYKGIYPKAAKLVEELRQTNPIQHRSMKGEFKGRTVTDHDRSVERTFLLSLKRLDPENPVDARALAVFSRASWFGPGLPIPHDLLLSTLGEDEDSEEVTRREEGLQRLVELGLVTGTEDGSLLVHRVIAAQGRKMGDTESARCGVEQATYGWANALNGRGFPRALLPWQAQFRAVTDQALADETGRAARLCSALDFHLDAVGNLQGARHYSERALAIRESSLGPDHPDTARSLNNLGFLLQSQGDLAGARPYYERALAINESSLGPDHPDTARSLNNLGHLLQSLGDLAGARPYYERALAIRESSLGPDHPDTARSLNNLGFLLQSQGDLTGARPYYERALAICESSLGPEHPLTALILNNLGSLLQSLGDLAGTRPYYERALAINESSLGPDHPDTARILNNLGHLLQSLGGLAGAQPYYERALAICESSLSPDHPNTAAILNNLGYLLQSQRDLAGARPYYERALAIRESSLGPDHPDTALSLNNLGMLLAEEGDREQGRKLVTRALEIEEKAYGPDHRRSQIARKNLARLQRSSFGGFLSWLRQRFRRYSPPTS